jgi:hypothetical protein
MDTAKRHQLRIARATLNMSDAMAQVMGGMSKAEALAIVEQHDADRRANRNAARKAHDQAYKDCGLVKVRGALGGTYYE